MAAVRQLAQCQTAAGLQPPTHSWVHPGKRLRRSGSGDRDGVAEAIVQVEMRWSPCIAALVLLAEMQLVGRVTAFSLECFGPGRGRVLPAAESVGTGAMAFPNNEWSRDRLNAVGYTKGVKTSNGIVTTHPVLDDQQNPPLWAPNGRNAGTHEHLVTPFPSLSQQKIPSNLPGLAVLLPPDFISTVTTGSDISSDRVDILSYKQVVTWRIERFARLFLPLLERQVCPGFSANAL